jgi:hypothetical protein
MEQKLYFLQHFWNYFNKSPNIGKKKNKANYHFECCDFEKPTKNHEKFMLLITGNDLSRY